MKLKPLNGRVVIKKIELPEKTESLIIVPEAENKPCSYGKVIAISDGKLSTSGKVSSPKVSVGDTVIIGKYAGTEVGNECVVVHEDDILGIVENS